MGTGEFTAGGNPAMDQHPIQGGVEILLVASCYGNRDKLWPDGPLGLYADFTFLKDEKRNFKRNFKPLTRLFIVNSKNSYLGLSKKWCKSSY